MPRVSLWTEVPENSLLTQVEGLPAETYDATPPGVAPVKYTLVNGY